MPKKDITVLLKKENSSSGDEYHYSFLIGGAVNNEWEKPKREDRKGYGGFLGINRKEIVYFEIPTDNQTARNHSHAHLHITNIKHSDALITKDLIQHNGTIHFPGTGD